MKLVIAAGGTGGHIFPALAVTLEIKKHWSDWVLLWIGTARSREREICDRYDIPLKILNIQGINRPLGIRAFSGLISFVREFIHMVSFFKKERPDTVIAFGGYVCAPVLAAARFQKIPFFIHEQNAVPGMVNRIFSSFAQCSFLGFPLQGKRRLKGETKVIGTPVRQVNGTYDRYPYPEGFNRSKKIILISGGSQGASSMNKCLLDPARELAEEGIQIVWQTGEPAYSMVIEQMSKYKNAFIFKSIDDLYPYYVCTSLVICRAGSSTLNEIAYFGLPCIMIPLPWASENHQWMNAGLVEIQGWGFRLSQDNGCGNVVANTVRTVLRDKNLYEKMSRKALDNSPAYATEEIIKEIARRI